MYGDFGRVLRWLLPPADLSDALHTLHRRTPIDYDALDHRKIAWPLIGVVAAHGRDDPARRASSQVCPHSAEQPVSECFSNPPHAAAI